MLPLTFSELTEVGGNLMCRNLGVTLPDTTSCLAVMLPMTEGCRYRFERQAFCVQDLTCRNHRLTGSI